MNDEIIVEERTYWERQAACRADVLEEARMRGDAPHVLAAAQLRLNEATERLANMPALPVDTLRP